MSEVVRLYRYKSLLSHRAAVAANELATLLEISRATLKRDIAKLRDQLHVPITYNHELGGYQLEQDQSESELPDLWFSQEEILLLVTIQHLLEQLEPGLLGTKLQPLQKRPSQLTDKHGLASQDVAKRNRIVHAGKRQVVAKSFELVEAATMASKRLRIWPSTGKTASPQSERCHHSAYCTTATTGVWMPGVTCGMTCATSVSMRSPNWKCWRLKPSWSRSKRLTRRWATAMASSTVHHRAGPSSGVGGGHPKQEQAAQHLSDPYRQADARKVGDIRRE